jgi:hypothetical protein
VGGACSTRWREMRTKYWSEILKGRDHLKDLGIDGGC